MSDLIIYGPAPSSYVRTARWAAAHKGVPHTLADAEEGLHPFAKFPAMRHGDLVLAETQAIVHYIDSAFDGPALTPTDPAEHGRAEQWVSYLNCYMYRNFIPRYALKYIFGGDSPDRAAIDAAVPDVESHLTLIEKGLDGVDWLGGGSELSIADLFLGPVLATVTMFPEASASVESKPNIKGYMSRIGSLKDYQSVQPPRPSK